MTAGDWACWDGESLELQRRLIRWYGINLASACPEPGFRRGYDNILAGPGGLLGAVHFPDAGITMPIFHDGWEGEGFVHRADSSFPAGEGGAAVLTLSGDHKAFFTVCQSLKQNGVFCISILDRTLTYRITAECPEENSCILELSWEGKVLRLTGILEEE